jgi:hypothetical protein
MRIFRVDKQSDKGMKKELHLSESRMIFKSITYIKYNACKLFIHFNNESSIK